MARTLRDYFEETRVRIDGGPDYYAGRRARMAAMIVDGRAVGDYETDVQRDYEGWKRFEELQWLALALVSCDADLEFAEFRSLAPRHGRATPDYEAIRLDGTIVRIEVFRLIDPAERLYLEAIQRIAGGAQSEIEALGLTGLSGKRYLRFYSEVPGRRDVPNAVKELADFITTDPRLQQRSLTLWPAGFAFPTLQRLGAHVAYTDAEGPFRVMVDPDRRLANPGSTIDAFYRMVEQKRRKFQEYSDGYPVWLACAVKTQLFYPLATIQRLGENAAFEPRPFERVLVGCFTAGVVFEDSHQSPRLT